jgi:hypothetical protein
VKSTDSCFEKKESEQCDAAMHLSGVEKGAFA